MLFHSTLDLLSELGLTGMAKRFQSRDAHPKLALDHAEWLRLLDQEVTVRRQKAGPGPPACAKTPASRTSTIKPLAVSTAACSSPAKSTRRAPGWFLGRYGSIAAHAYPSHASGEIVADFTETESKRADRHELRVALAEAKRHRYPDPRPPRPLSRNMAFIANLRTPASTSSRVINPIRPG